MAKLSSADWFRLGALGFIAIALAGGLAYQRFEMQALAASAQNSGYQQYSGTKKSKADKSKTKKNDKQPTAPPIQHVPYKVDN
jgi:hypothetical protein